MTGDVSPYAPDQTRPQQHPLSMLLLLLNIMILISQPKGVTTNTCTLLGVRVENMHGAAGGIRRDECLHGL